MSQLKPIRILYMEDDEGLANLVKSRLEEYKVEIAGDGEEGLAMYKAGSYDMIALDYDMPVYNGLEVIEKLLSMGDLPPTIMITGAGDENLVVEAMKFGIGDYIVKDFEGRYLELLPAKIEQILKQHKLALEKKRAEEALKDSEERYRNLIENINDVIFNIDMEGKFTYISPVVEELFGYKLEEVINRSFIEFVHPDDINGLLKSLGKTVIGKLEPYEFRVISKNDEIGYIRTSSRFQFKEGVHVGLTGVMTDITEQKMVEVALLKGEEKYRELFDNMSSGVAVYEVKDDGKDFIFKDFNKAGERIDGDKREDLVGKSIFDVRPGVEDFGLIDVFRRVWKTNKSEYYPVTLYKDERLTAWYENFVYKLSSGEIVTVFDDITDRKWVEEKIIHLNRVLRSIRDVDQLIVREKDKDVLLKESCKIINEVTGYRLVWIGFLEEGHKRVIPVANAGFNEGYLDNIKITWDDTKAGKGPIGTAIKTKKVCVFNDALNNDNFLPWKKEAEKRGYRSLIAVPIIHNNKIFGILNVCSEVVNAFVDEEIDLLVEISGDIALALYTIELEHERDKTRGVFKESEKRYLDLVENVGDMVYVFDDKGDLKFFNKSTEEHFGYTKEELQNRNFKDLVSSKSFEDVVKKFKKQLADEDVGTFELEFVNSKGEIRFIEARERLVWEGNRIVEIHGIGRDITKRKQAEQVIRESEERYRLLFDNMHNGFAYHEIVLNDEGQPIDYIFLEVNDVFEETTGLKRKDVIGKKATEALPGIEEDDFDWIGVYGKVALTGEGTTFSQYSEFPGKWFAVTAYSPRKGFFAVLFEDVTEKKRMEEQLLRRQKMEALGTLTGGIAHDFNNILATVLGYASFLKKKIQKGDPFYEGLFAIEKSAIRASNLTSQLLAYTRRGKLEVKPVNMNRVVKEVYDLITKTFDKSIKIELETESNLKAVGGDESQLNQVVINIAVNAQNAMPEGGTFKIKTYMEKVKKEIKKEYFNIEPGNYVCMKFTDTGAGMDERTLKRIFEPYFTTGGDRGGSGLGMSVVFGIVKGHDGYIDIASKSGKGTVITIHLPASKMKEEILDKVVGEVVGGSETLLIIDDEKETLTMLKGTLEDSGYKVYTSSSGKMGLKMFKEKDIDLVILDIKMPVMGGEEVLEKLLEIDSEVKVILASGYSEEGQHHSLLKMGAKGFIGKPFVVDKLLIKMREILG